MRIQAINNNYNQNNISHKAHFKPTVDLSEICAKAKKTPSLLSALDRFKNKLPKHQIEILSFTGLDSGKIKVINKVTSKVKEILWKNRETALETLLYELSLSTNKDFFSKKTSIDTHCYNFLTNIDYTPTTNDGFINETNELTDSIVEKKKQ